MGIGAAVERKTIKDALPPLGKLTMWLWAWGLMMLLTLFCRAIFGTLNGAVGWIPFAGRIITSPIHKIEQKVSNYIGGAVQHIDAHIATSWHRLAAVVRDVPSALVDQAGLIFGLAAALVVLPSYSLVKWLIHRSVGSVASVVHGHSRAIAHEDARQKALQKSVAQGVYPRLKAGEVYDRTVARPATRTIRAEAKAAEAEAIRLFRWLSKHRLGVATAVFTGAVALALRDLGGRWIRCKNWRAIGKHVCGLPYSLIEGLLGGVFGVFLFSELCRVIVIVGDVAATVLPKLVSVLAQAEVALCGGRYSATPAMELRTTALPTVDNPLTF